MLFKQSSPMANMRHDRNGRPTMCNSCVLLLISVLYSSISLPCAHAQDTIFIPLTLARNPSVTMLPTANLDSTTNGLLALSSLPCTSGFPNQPPFERHSELSIAAEQPQHRSQVKNRVFNYYFLFLALLVCVLALLLWWLHRHRRREREQMRVRGQHALARDVEHWAMNRRNQPHTVEGLNESGEAPPPYKPKSGVTTALEPVINNPHDAIVSLPPRILTRAEIEHARLPNYVETVYLNNIDVGTEPAKPVDQSPPACASDNATQAFLPETAR